MLKERYEEYYFTGNYNCAECIIRAANDEYNFGLNDTAMRMMAAYGAGMQCGNTCGAVTACVAVLSLLYVEDRAHLSTDIRPVCTLFIRKVNAVYGSTLCKDIKPQTFKKEIRCQLTIEKVLACFEETVKEYEESRKNIF
ncbi:MAG: C-GCAxxG-C-C family (seleno)protein [Erysipelotrichaceae bacterium]|nr:C-GCAxxG-C-C family (seleno)protein [Erysipelotrichaceae bacterium]